MDESINTLKFAARAKLIRTSAKVNEVMDEKSMLRTYKEEIRLLREKLLQMERREPHSVPLQEASEAMQECGSSYELPGLELPDMQYLESKDEEVMLKMIAEMETLILKADLSIVERNQLMSLSFDLDDNLLTSKKRFSSVMDCENSEEMVRKHSRDEESVDGASFIAAQRLLAKKAPLGSPPLVPNNPSTYIESRLREMQRNAEVTKEYNFSDMLVNPSQEDASQAFKKRKKPLQALSLGDSCDDFTSAESDLYGCSDSSAASVQDRLGIVPMASPSPLFRYNSPNKRWRQSKGGNLRPQGSEELPEEHDESILFGVTKILSVLKGYIATSKSR